VNDDDHLQLTPAGTRERLRAVHDTQQAILASYVAAAAKVDKHRRQLHELEADMQLILGELVTVLSPQLAVELLGVSAAAARDAANTWRQHRDGRQSEPARPSRPADIAPADTTAAGQR
jgi:hypothetical protein